MNEDQRYFFSLHDLLVMAALAALGGVSGSLIGMVRTVVHAAIALPGGMQFLAGIHVLWMVLAAGLVRKPFAATATGLLAGGVELLSGNPHGLLVVIYGGMGGLAVDLVWLLLGGLHHPVTYVLAGGLGAASNVLIFKYVASFSDLSVITSMLWIMAAIASASGMVFAGMLGWWLLRALERAGVTGAATQPLPYGRGSLRPRHRAWAAACLLVAAAGLAWAAGRLSIAEKRPAPETARRIDHAAGTGATPDARPALDIGCQGPAAPDHAKAPE